MNLGTILVVSLPEQLAAAGVAPAVSLHDLLRLRTRLVEIEAPTWPRPIDTAMADFRKVGHRFGRPEFGRAKDGAYFRWADFPSGLD